MWKNVLRVELKSYKMKSFSCYRLGKKWHYKFILKKKIVQKFKSIITMYNIQPKYAYNTKLICSIVWTNYLTTCRLNFLSLRRLFVS